MLRAREAEPAPALIVDPMMQLGQMRAEIHAVLTAWGRTRPRPAIRWRHTTSRDLQAFDFIQEHFANTGKAPTNAAVAQGLRCSEDQARWSVVRASALIGPPMSTITFESHLETCVECHTTALCPVGERLLNRSAGVRPLQDLLPRNLERIEGAITRESMRRAKELEPENPEEREPET